MAKRIQRRRSRGWQMPLDAVLVCRPTEWGNPYRVSKMVEVSPESGKITHIVETNSSLWRFATKAEAHIGAVTLYRHWLSQPQNERLRERAKIALRGKDLCCWCAPALACHADVLLEMANT